MPEEKEKRKKIHHEVINQIITLTTSAFGLVAALGVLVTLQLTGIKERLEK